MRIVFKISILIFGLSILNGTLAYSQESQDYHKKYNSLNDSIIKYEDDNTRLAILFAKKQLVLAEQSKDTIHLIEGLKKLGRFYQGIAEFNKAIEVSKREFQLLKKIDVSSQKYAKVFDHTYEVEAMLKMGRSNFFLGNVKEGLSLFDEAAEISKEKNLDNYYNYIIPFLKAELLTEFGNYNDALLIYKELYSIVPTLKNKNEIEKKHSRSILSILLSRNYQVLQETDSALWALKRGEKENLHNIDAYSKLLYQAQFGEVYLSKKDYNKAIVHLKEAEKVGYEYDSVIAPANVSLPLGECYYVLGDYNQAISTLEKGIRVKELRVKEIFLTDDYSLLAKVYKEAGNLEKSNEYYEKYVINKTALERSKDTLTTDFHDKELHNLNKEKASQKSKLQYIIGSILVLVLGLFFVIGYLIKEKRQNASKFKKLLYKINIESEEKLTVIDTKDSLLEEKSSADVSDEITEQILNGLEKLKEQEYFLNGDCNSYNVAKKIKTNTSYLSKVINAQFEKNFNTYINDLRINYALIQLKENSRFRSFSVQSIAEELGYKSADSFTKYFKLRTGLNPSFYIKQLDSLD